MSSTPRIGFVSLGCPKALVDSERILTQLRAEGYEVSASYEAADLVVVNTCGFIDDAIHEVPRAGAAVQWHYHHSRYVTPRLSCRVYRGISPPRP